jgi:ABC-type glycerol-3-phosphate transport system substrate-binding protein
MEQLNWISTALANTIAKGTPLEQEIETARANIPPTPQATEDDSPIVVATPQAPLPEGVTAVNYFFNQYGMDELNTIKTLAEQFNQISPDVHILVYTEFHGSPMDDWIAAMAERFDCFTTNSAQGQPFDTSQVLSLNAFMRDEPASFGGDFSKIMLDKFSIDGSLFALPASSQLQMIAYNADLLARRGLQTPGSDWTFDDFMMLATAVASTSSTDPSYGYMYGSYDDFIPQGMGIEWADFESSPPVINLNSPEMLEHLEWLAKSVQENVLYDQETDWEKTDSLIMSGQLGFWTTMMGEEEMWFYGRDEKPAYKIGVLPFPGATGDVPITTWSNDRGHYISAQSQNPQACWDWIKFLTEQPNVFAGVPVRRSIAESPAWESFIGKEKSEAYRTALKNLVPVQAANLELQNVIWPLNSWRSQVIRAALDGQELQPVLVSTQRKADAYLDCALLIDTSQPYEQVDEAVRSCLLQADPEGTW